MDITSALKYHPDKKETMQKLVNFVKMFFSANHKS